MTDDIGNPINRRSMLKTLGAGLGLAGASTLAGVSPVLGADTFKVTLQLGWLPTNGILGEVAADKLGYFAEEGLELEVIPGGPNIDGVASVASGRAKLGQISSSPSLMLARAAGIPVKCIAAGYQQHPFTYFSLEKNPVRRPQDLIGKKVATNGTARILLRALLAANGIAEDQVEVSVMGSDMNPLLTGQADVVTGWKTNVNALEVLGDKRVDMTLWDAGVQLYANPYYVTERTLADHPEQVTAMIRAIARGWGWVHDNPEEAVDILVSRFPNMDRASEMKAVDMALAYTFNENTAKAGWGVMTRENWQAQIDTYEALGQFAKGAPSAGDVMTLEVLERTQAARPLYG